MRAPAKCGTDSGYFRHLRTTHTDPCDACLVAHSEAVQRSAKKYQRERKTVPCRCGVLTIKGRCPGCAQKDRYAVPRERRDDVAYTGSWRVVRGILRPVAA